MQNASFTPRLQVQQKITAFVNKYRIYHAGADSVAGEMYSFAQQKRDKIKEKITFYSDESKKTPVYTLRAEKVLDVHGRYFVEDMEGKLIGGFRKDFKKSLALSTWYVFDADQQDIFIVRENNYATAILRRFSDFIPLVGDLIGVIMSFIKYHFEIIDKKTGEEVGVYRKIKLYRDHYSLDMDDGSWSMVDPRVAAALGVALDALQSR